MPSLGHTLRRAILEHGRESAINAFNDAYAAGQIRPQDVSFRELAQGLLGDNWAAELQRGVASFGREAVDAVDASAFTQITGNILIEAVRQGYNSPEFTADQLVTHIPVTNGNLERTIQPWLSEIPTPADLFDNNDFDSLVTEPGMPGQSSQFVPNYIQLERPQKRVLFNHLTFEMIYADRTGQAKDRSMSVGKTLRRVKEYRILKVVYGIHNNYRFSYGGSDITQGVTYRESAAGLQNWVNQLDNRPLTNYTDINAALQLFVNMRDPNTNEPIDINPNTIIVSPQMLPTATYILRATGIRVGEADAANAILTYAGTPLPLPYNLYTNRYADKLITTSGLAWPTQTFFQNDDTETLTPEQARGMWLIGDFPKAFYYREVEPLQVVQAPPMNPLEFEREIVLSVRAREYGVAGVSDPRYAVRVMPHNFNP